MSMIQWHDSLFCDSEKNEFVLKRKYKQINQQGLWAWCDYYSSHPERMKEVAKGITAYFSERDSCIENSMRVFLHNRQPFDIESLYQKYYDNQFTYLNNLERLNPFKKERKSELELVYKHLGYEHQLLIESKMFYDEVMDFEVQIIETIKKASIMYPAWVQETHVKRLEQPSLSENEGVSQTNHVSVPVWALYYYYLQKAKYIPYFDGQLTTKDEAMQNLISENKHEFSFNHFRNVFYAIGRGKEKDPLKESYVKRVVILLKEYPIAKQLAGNDLYSFEKRVINNKYK